jgi:hypothetical protein
MRLTLVLGLPLLLAGCLVDTSLYASRLADLTDRDGDGWTPADGDCDDADRHVYPAAADGCDGVDNDCDGAVDTQPDLAWYLDADGDGYGAAAWSLLTCTAPEGYVADATDCDDDDGAVSPGAAERCNGADDDCDELADEGLTPPTWYVDGDADGYGVAVGAVTACDAPAGTADVAGDCDDGEPLANPGLPEQCGDGVDNDCSGDATGCSWSAQMSSADADARLFGRTAGDGAGAAMVTADFDEDGFDDVLVGAAAGNVAQLVRGVGTRRDDLYLASQADVVLTPDPTDLAPGFVFARAVTACDFGGDGAPELVVGGYDPTGDSLVFLFDGGTGANTTTANANYIVAGISTADRFGAALGCADVNGDGAPDLLVGAPGQSDFAEEAGAIHVLYGAVGDTRGFGELEEDRVWAWGRAAADAVGASLAAADFDGDGFADVVVGSAGADEGGVDAGGAWIMLGPIDTLGSVAAEGSELVAPDPGSQAGAVAAGDLDGDGTADVVVGAPLDDTAGSGAGAVYVVLSAGGSVSEGLDLAAAGARVLPDGTQRRFGATVAVVGDLQGSGGASLAVSAQNGDTGATGVVYLFDGNRVDGLVTTNDATTRWTGEGIGDELGDAVAGGGDLDGDGLEDLLLGAPGQDAFGTDAGMVYLAYGDGL